MRLFLACILLATAASAQDVPPEADARWDLVVAVEGLDGEAIAGATVLVGNRGASTDADGEASIRDLRPGRYRVQVSFIGLETRQIAARLDAPGPWTLVVELAPVDATLGEIVVEARDLSGSRLAADGFFERMASGFGRVLTRDEIERRNPVRLGDALSAVGGIQVRTRSVSELGDVSGRVVTSIRRGEPCEMAIYLDGSYAPFLTEDIDTLAAQDIVAIEVYQGPSQIPTFYNQLGRGEGCGVVLVWTSLSLAEGE